MQISRLLKVGATGAAVALLAAACGSGGSSSTPSASPYAGPVGKGEGTLNVLAWPGYAEDGSTDPAVDWVTPFEQKTGCQVNVKTFGTSDEAVQLMSGGGYDVVSASGDATLRLVAADKVQPVNTSLVPNYADVFAGLKDKSWNTVDGVNYGIPHGRGANILMYRTDKVSPAPDSWAITFDPNSPQKGSVTAYDSPIFIADAAVYLMATQPDLGIKDPYALDQTQFDAAVALLTAQKAIIGEYWSDYTKYLQASKAGTTTVGTSWQVIQNLAAADGTPVESVKPKEGATGWSDTWMVAKDTKSINCSYLWLDWIVSPEVNAQVAEWFGEAPANEKSCALTADKDHCATFHAGEEDYWSDVYYWNTPSEKCLDGRTDVKCVPYSEWSKAWSSLRNA
ncbi:MAG: ABC transporter substrate-binding protein [Actinobacteria bacterium]|nr:ABC transporter substrate-binding protein [Actinomycetota bacterium]